jgi:16S rRNA processing protein RimM
MSSRSSRTEPEDPAQRVAVGRVVRPHGLRGEVVVEVLSDVPERFDPGSELQLVRETREARQAGQPGKPRPVVVATRRPHRAGALVRFEGFADRDHAEELRGAWLEIDESRVPAAPAGTYYHFQLMGCRCSAGGEDLGRVVDLLEDGGGLLLMVSDGERQVPIPFVARFLRRVDVEAGAIELELPPGLLETCGSRS